MPYRVVLFASPTTAQKIEAELGAGFAVEIRTALHGTFEDSLLEAGTDAVVIARDSGSPTALARAVRLHDLEVPILILGEDASPVEAAAIRLDPYLPGPVRAVPRAGLGDRVRAESALRRQAQAHRATLSAVQSELARHGPGTLPTAKGAMTGLFDLLPLGLLLVAPDARIVSANRWACDRLTTAPVIAAGSSLQSVFPEPAAGSLREAILSGSAADTPARDFELELTLPGGEVAAFVVTVLPDRPDRGKGAVLLVQDVTLLRLAEQARRTAERTQATASLSAGISHHMNNLLAAILGNVELIEDQLESGPALARVEAVYRNIARAERLNRALLIHAGLERYHPREIDLDETLGSLASEMFPEPQDAVRFSYRVEAEARRIATDPEQLDGALRILVQNAREAIDGAGRIEVVVGLDVAEAAPGGTQARSRVRVEVRDEGAGMTPEILAQAFDPFFTTHGMAEHAGLGLAIARGFARRAGGELLLESSPGRGTVASLILPVAAAPEVAQGHEGDAGRL